MRGDRCGPRAYGFPLVTRPASDDPLNLRQLIVWGEKLLAFQTEPCSGAVEPLWASCCRLSNEEAGGWSIKALPANLLNSGVLSEASLLFFELFSHHCWSGPVSPLPVNGLQAAKGCLLGLYPISILW